MKITKTTLTNLIKKELGRLLEAPYPDRTWLGNLVATEPTSMGTIRKGKSIAHGPRSKDRYPHFRHVNQAIGLLYRGLKEVKDDLQYEWEESHKGLFAQEGQAAEILKYTADVNKAIKRLESSDYIRRRDVLDESFPNAEWDEIRNLLQGEGGLQDILEDTILDDRRFFRLAELFNFAAQVTNARLESIRTGFILDPGGIRALVKIPAGVDYEKPEA